MGFLLCIHTYSVWSGLESSLLLRGWETGLCGAGRENVRRGVVIRYSDFGFWDGITAG